METLHYSNSGNRRTLKTITIITPITANEVLMMFHLIEDESQLLELLQEIVESSGYKSKQFKSAEQYLEYSNSSEFAAPIAILSDYQMDELTGLDLIKEIRKRTPFQRAVIITGKPSPVLDKSIHDHLCHLLHKPYQIDKIFRLLETLDRCEHECQSNYEFQIDCSYGLAHKCPFS